MNEWILDYVKTFLVGALTVLIIMFFLLREVFIQVGIAYIVLAIMFFIILGLEGKDDEYE